MWNVKLFQYLKDLYDDHIWWYTVGLYREIIFKYFKHPLIVKKLKREFPIGTIVERCDYHIGPIIYADYADDYLIIRSMFNGSEGACSFSSCGVHVVPKENIAKLCQLYEDHGIESVIEYRENEEKEWLEKNMKNFEE